MNDYVIWGAGERGIRALKEIGRENVICFIDSDTKKQTELIEGKKIISFEKLRKITNAKILVAIEHFEDVVKIIEKFSYEYEIWFPRKNWYGDRTNLLLNPYINRQMQLANENCTKVSDAEIKHLNSCAIQMAKQDKIFNHIEIETYNRCNGGCDFCPVSVRHEKRTEKFMSQELFNKIIFELRKMKFDGCVALFSNNEPFLDSRLLIFLEIAREQLPNAKMHLFTNGTILTLEKFKKAIRYLDELIIDNYSENLKLIPTNKKIYDYCIDNEELSKKVTIILRNPREILEARAGQAPNKQLSEELSNVKCVHPFRQMIIRPDGKVSLCCNDAIGLTVMGDASNESLNDIWFGEKFEQARAEIIKNGRRGFEFCKNCDSMRMV